MKQGSRKSSSPVKALAALGALLGISLTATGQVTPPYTTDFEPSTGYTLGSLQGQNGWQVTQGTATVTNVTAFSGTQSIFLQPGSSAAQINLGFNQATGFNVTYVDFYLKPDASTINSATSSVTAEGSLFSVLRLDSTGHILVFSGDGSGSGKWVVTPASLALDSSGQATSWTRFTIRQDYTAKKWDLYVNGVMVAADLGQKDNSKTFLSQFLLTSYSGQSGYFDYLYVGTSNPLFVDASNDGIDDAWKTAHGLSTTTDVSESDLDGDGLTNIQEYVLGTNPAVASTAGDGVPDGWKMQHGLAPSTNYASADPGGVGRTVLQSYQQSLTPWPAPAVASGLALWLKADANILTDSSSNVTQWMDVSGSSVAFSQYDSLPVPKLLTNAIGGKPAVQFSGSASLRSSLFDLLSGASDVSVFVEVRSTSSQPNTPSMMQFATDPSLGFLVGQSNSGTGVFSLQYTDSTSTLNGAGIGATIGSGLPQLVEFVKSGTTLSSYASGVLQQTGTVSAGLNGTIAAMSIGGLVSGSSLFSGQIAEVLVYNRALAPTERQSIEAALTAKYVNNDSNGNGIPDSWEIQYLGNLSYAAIADPGGVGRTLLQSYQQGLSPWPSATVPTGLQAWYRADEGVIKDSNLNVTQWTDISGNGYHVVQTGGVSKEPLLVASAMNGKAAVQFSSNEVLTSAAAESLQSGANDITVITVLKPGATQSYAATVFSWGTDNNVSFGLTSPTTNTNAYQLDWGTGSSTATGPLVNAAAGQVQVITEIKSGTAASDYLNGAVQGTITVPSAMSQTAAPLAMGNAAYPYYGFSGQVAEVLVYNRALSATERQSVEAALIAKYISADSDGDGLPDAWEMTYLGTLSYGANDDPGNVGRTLLQSYQQGLSPWPTPTIASGLQAWYRADAGVVSDSSNNVSQWTDVSGNGFHVVQTENPSKEPQLVAAAMNGRPAIQFTPQQVLATSQIQNLEAGANDVTVIAVLKPSATQGYASTVYSWGTDSNVSFGLTSAATNVYQLDWGTGTSTITGPALNTVAGQVQVVTEIKSGTIASGYVNGAAQGTSTVPSSMAQTAATLAMGNAAYPYYGFTGQVAELLVYNRALSDSERQTIEAALTTKYVSQDTNNNGIPDSWELKYLGTLSYGASADPGGVGRTILQSYQQGLSPWPTATVPSGLQAWYRADLGIVNDSNNNVSQWTDVSGSGYHVIQTATPSKEPLFVASAMNGKPAVLFESNQVLTTAAVQNLEAGGSDVTVIAVLKPDASQNYAGTVYSWGTDNNVSFGLTSASTNVYQLDWSSGTSTITGPHLNTTAGQVQILSEVKSGTAANGYVNGALQGSSTVPSSLGQTPATLAMGNAAYPYYGFNGQVAEVLVYNRALSDTERQSVEAALTAKYVDSDSNGNGIPDAWELKYLGTLSYGATADPGGVGRTLLQSYQQGLSPWPTATVSSGLQAWYRADLGIVSDSDNNVSQWTDLSGSGYHVIQTATPSKEPVLVASAMNGKPAVLFESNQVLTTAAAQNIEASGSDVTVIAVLKPDATQNYAGTVYSWGTDGNVSFGLTSASTNIYQLDWSSGTNTITGPHLNTTAGQVQILSEVKNGTTASGYVNGAAQGSSTVPSSLGQTPATLAMGNAAYPYSGFNGQVAEVLVYNRALSDSERQSVESALAAKYVNSDSNGNGIPDAWELQYLGTLSYGASADPGGVGRTLLQSYQQDLSPWPTATIPSGLQAWYRADKGVVANGSNNVTQWTDLSGNGFHVVQTANPSKEPVLASSVFNGLPAVVFSSQDVLATSAIQNLEAGGSDVTVIAVLQPDATQNYASTIYSWGTDGNVSFGLTSASTNVYQLDWGTGAGTVTGPTMNAATTAAQILTQIKSGTTATGYINGTAGTPETVPSSMAQIPATLAMGNAAYPYYGFNGKVAEVLVYNRALTTVERQSVEAALTAKYVTNDTNGNGIPDSWEMQYLGTLKYGANDDPGQIGRTILQSYQQGLSPLPTPKNISGLSLWLSGDVVGTVSSSGTVTTWTDQSTNNFSVVQSSASSAPTLIANAINGLPILRFSGGQSYALPNILNGANAGEIYVVLKSDVGSGVNGPWVFGGNIGTYYPDSDGVVRDDFGSTQRLVTAPPNSGFAAYHVYRVTAQNGLWQNSFNGVPLFETTSNQVSFTSSPRLGTALARSFSGDIAELLIYNHALSAAQSTQVYAYLGNKYGLFASAASPTNLSATAIAPTQVSLQWVNASATGPQNYLIERSTNGSAFVQVAEAINSLSFMDSAVTASQSYTYRVRATSFTVGISSYSNIATVSTPAAGVAMPMDSMRLWLKADAGLGGPGAVSVWLDQSGSGNDAAQSNASGEPVVVQGAINQLPVVRFSGGQSFALPNFMSGAAAGEIFAVLKSSVGTGVNGLWNLGGGSPGGTYYPDVDGVVRDDFGSTSRQTTAAPPTGFGAYHVYNVTAQPNLWTSRVNGSPVFSSTSNTVVFNPNPSIGSAAARAFNGDFAEIIVYSRPLSSDERAAVYSYLGNKYALYSPSVAPSGVAAIGLSPTQTSVTWQGQLNNVPVSYYVERSLDGVNFTQIASVLSGFSFLDTGLSAGTTYSYRVRSKGFAGTYSAYTNIAAATTLLSGADLPLAGMRVWLKADCGVNSTGSVAYWADQSGNGNNAEQGNSGAQPIVVSGTINGFPVIRFSGGQSFGLSNVMSGATAGEIYAVLRSDVGTGVNGLWNLGGGSPGGTYYPDVDGVVRDDFGSTSRQTSAAPTIGFSAYHLYNVGAAYDYWSSSVNGAALFSTAANQVSFTSSPTIGAAQNHGFNGDFAEIIIYDHILSPQEREVVSFYLNNKYAFTNTAVFDQYRDGNFDGLPDAVDRQLGIDPSNLDVDGDGYSNLVEELAGSDPLDPTSVPPPPLAPIPGKTTPPTITLTEPANATPED